MHLITTEPTSTASGVVTVTAQVGEEISSLSTTTAEQIAENYVTAQDIGFWHTVVQWFMSLFN